MVINLGNIVQGSDGRSRAVGLSSGLDSEAIIKSLVDTKRIPIGEYEADIKTIDSKVGAFGDLRTILTTLQSSVNFLRNVPGVNKADENAFEYRTSGLSSNTITTPSSLLSISAAPGAATGRYEVSIGTLAQAKELRTNAFTSKSASVTEAAGGTTAGQFSEGVFQTYTARQEDVSVNATGTPVAGNFDFEGTPTGVVSAVGGITFDETVDETLVGDISGFAGTFNDGGASIDLQVSINGKLYVADNVALTAGVLTNGSVLTFNYTNTSGSEPYDTSFQITINGDQSITSQADVNTLETNLDSALSTVSIFQTRQISNFSPANKVGTLLDDLNSSHVKIKSNDYTATGELGTIERFTVNAVSTSGAQDGSISVVIDGVTYSATGLGNLADNRVDTNLVLTSAGGDELQIDLGDAGVYLDLSDSTTSSNAKISLDAAFGLLNVGQIDVQEGDSLAAIASKINQVSGNSKVSANVIQVSDTDFRLTLRSDNEGIANAFEIFDESGVTTQVTLNTKQAAVDAEFKIDGLTITRSTNTITDVLEGITFNLLGVTPDYGLVSEEIISAEIEPDSAGVVKNQIIAFIDAYNAFRVFEAEQTLQDEDGVYDEEAFLQNDSVLRSLDSSLGNEIIAIVDGLLDGNLSTLSALGITVVDFEGDAANDLPETKNILQLDEDVLDAALANNFDQVRKVFEFSFSSSSSELAVFSRSNSLDLTEFRLVINKSANEGEQVEVRNLAGTFLFYADLQGSIISGVEGTALEGLQLIYTGGNTATIDVTLSQGIADRIYNILDETLEEDSGTLDIAVESLRDEQDRLEDEIEELELQIDDYELRLINQYANLEAAVDSANILIQLLETQNEVSFSSGQ